MCNLSYNDHHRMPHRDFMKTVGTTLAGVSPGADGFIGLMGAGQPVNSRKKTTLIRGTFLYLSANILEEEGYYSWPGADFNAGERQREYIPGIKEIEKITGVGNTW